MKNFVTGSICMLAIAISGAAGAMERNIAPGDAGNDAIYALHLTRCSVFADLQETIQSSFHSLHSQRFEAFGIDDTDSYTQKNTGALRQLASKG